MNNLTVLNKTDHGQQPTATKQLSLTHNLTIKLTFNNTYLVFLNFNKTTYRKKSLTTDLPQVEGSKRAIFEGGSRDCERLRVRLAGLAFQWRNEQSREEKLYCLLLDGTLRWYSLKINSKQLALEWTEQWYTTDLSTEWWQCDSHKSGGRNFNLINNMGFCPFSRNNAAWPSRD